MKKIIIFLLVALTPNLVSAQLKVTSNGKVSIGDCTPYGASNLRIYQNYSTESTSSPCGINQELIVGNSYSASGVYAHVRGTGQTLSATGVHGAAANALNGFNYGVEGILTGDNHGTGVYGACGGLIHSYVAGNYAGFFVGPTYINGTLTATEVVTPSDMNLKENVNFLANIQNTPTATLDNLMGMNVITYNYKERSLLNPENPVHKLIVDGDSIREITISSKEEVDRRAGEPKQLHYGLSAQELKEIYPDLVREGQDGYLCVNYTELVPILIRSIQELNQKIEELEGNNKTRSVSGLTDKTGTIYTDNVLYQNNPNPFKEQTIIRFHLADNVMNAAICIFDMSGKMLKKLPVLSGMNSVTVNGFELGEGMFLYSLIINGKEIDTKKMIIARN